MSIASGHYGKTGDGQKVLLFKLINNKGMSAEITNYGGIIVSLTAPDRNNKFDDVVLGFDSFEKYIENSAYMGAIIGRYANRIEGAEFELNGVEYKLNKNEGENHLHGGIKGFDKALWDADMVSGEDREYLELAYRSKDGEENYPGNLDVRVTYSLKEDHSLVIDYHAVSDRDTVVNLTNHAYFNLSGHGAGNIGSHRIKINADKYTVINQETISTGEVAEVKGTPMDFTEMRAIGPGLESSFRQIQYGGGYDHNWVLNVSGNSPEKAAEVYDENTGRIMEVYTTKPGMQFYTGNFLDGSLTGKGGTVYGKRSGFCLETQYFPNSLGHRHFPSPVLKAGKEYRHTTIYRFSAQ